MCWSAYMPDSVRIIKHIKLELQQSAAVNSIKYKYVCRLTAEWPTYCVCALVMNGPGSLCILHIFCTQDSKVRSTLLQHTVDYSPLYVSCKLQWMPWKAQKVYVVYRYLLVLGVRHMVDSFTWQNMSAPKGPSSVEKRVKTNWYPWFVHVQLYTIVHYFWIMDSNVQLLLLIHGIHWEILLTVLYVLHFECNLFQL